MSLVYFADDGSYGEVNNLTVLNTSQWTGDDWLMVASAPDGQRLPIAIRIGEKYASV